MCCIVYICVNPLRYLTLNLSCLLLICVCMYVFVGEQLIRTQCALSEPQSCVECMWERLYSETLEIPVLCKYM